MRLYKTLPKWGDDRLLDECRKLLETKGDDADWQPYFRELMTRVGNHRTPHRKPGRPPLKRNDVESLAKTVGVLVKQAETLRKNTAYVQAQVAGLSSNNRQ